MGVGIKEFYHGKTIFLTGTTGFVGKVVLEKMIRDLGTFKKLFVMIRAKKNQSPRDRFENEILSSEIFAKHLKRNPNFKIELRDRVVPVVGDLIIDKLGMSPADRAMVTEECQVVINCAASVNFDDPLLDALQINYFGCLRMMELAKECKNILAYTHVSTAYVNSNMPDKTSVLEKIYDLPNNQDPEDLVAKIQALGPQKVQEQEQKILGNYANTYTFCKSLAERTIKKRHGNLPCTILRPSIVTACKNEPYRGWLDSSTSTGGFVKGYEAGIMHFVFAKPDTKMDFIPCDMVSNNILVQTAITAMQPLPQLNVIHATASAKNPTTIS